MMQPITARRPKSGVSQRLLARVRDLRHNAAKVAGPRVSTIPLGWKTMATGWLHGTIAMVVEGTVALAIFAGLAGVAAAQLQTNQQLLDQRVEQLAGGQDAGPGINFSIDQNPAAGSPDMPGSFPRSILLPGTDTSMKVYGEVGEVLGYGFTGRDPGGLSNGSFSQWPGPSKLGLETRTPTPLGEARTVIEFDR